MAKNTGNGSRRGAVKNRSEFKHPNGTYVKRNSQSGRIMNVSKNPHMGGRPRREVALAGRSGGRAKARTVRSAWP